MINEIKVGIADYKIASGPDRLITIGLGSCVGIAIYDKYTKVGGLSHIMLPDSTLFTKDIKVEKFADLAIPRMVEEIIKMRSKNLVAKIAGGASMFNFPDKKMTSDIGARNVVAVEKKLLEMRIPILSSHTGGNMGRTMIVDLDSFQVNIRTANREIITL